MSKMAARLQRTLAKANRGEAVFTLSPLGDRGEPRPGIRSMSEVADAISWEEVQAASQPKVSINLRVRPDVLDFFRGGDPRGIPAANQRGPGSLRPDQPASGSPLASDAAHSQATCVEAVAHTN